MQVPSARAFCIPQSWDAAMLSTQKCDPYIVARNFGWNRVARPIWLLEGAVGKDAEASLRGFIRKNYCDRSGYLNTRQTASATQLKSRVIRGWR